MGKNNEKTKWHRASIFVLRAKTEQQLCNRMWCQKSVTSTRNIAKSWAPPCPGRIFRRADKGWEHLSALSSPSALGEHWNEAEINTFCNHDSWQDASESEQPQKHGGGRCSRWSGRTANKYSFCFGKYNNRPQQKRAHTSSTWRAKFKTVRGKFYCNFYKGNLSSLSTARLLSQTTANKWVVEDDQIVFDGSSLSELK